MRFLYLTLLLLSVHLGTAFLHAESRIDYVVPDILGVDKTSSEESRPKGFTYNHFKLIGPPRGALLSSGGKDASQARVNVLSVESDRYLFADGEIEVVCPVVPITVIRGFSLSFTPEVTSYIGVVEVTTISYTSADLSVRTDPQVEVVSSYSPTEAIPSSDFYMRYRFRDQITNDTLICVVHFVVIDFNIPMVDCGSPVVAILPAGDSYVSDTTGWNIPPLTNSGTGYSSTITRTGDVNIFDAPIEISPGTYSLNYSEELHYDDGYCFGTTERACTKVIRVYPTPPPLVVNCPSDTVRWGVDYRVVDTVRLLYTPRYSGGQGDISVTTQSFVNSMLTSPQIELNSPKVNFPNNFQMVYTFKDTMRQEEVCTVKYKLNLTNDPFLCRSNVVSVLPDGETSKDVTWDAPINGSTGDSENGTTTVVTPPSGSLFTTSSTSVEHKEYYRVADTLFSKRGAQTCNFLVILVPPGGGEGGMQVFCPDTVRVPIVASECEGVATWTEPSASGGVEPYVLVSQSFESGDLFPLGYTTVEYVFSDANSETSSCSFVVEVIRPLVCQGGAFYYADGSGLGTHATSANPSFNNCGGLYTIERDPPNSFYYPLGRTEVSFWLVDGDGEVSSTRCSFNLDVLGLHDVTNQSPSCPPSRRFYMEDCERFMIVPALDASYSVGAEIIQSVAQVPYRNYQMLDPMLDPFVDGSYREGVYYFTGNFPVGLCSFRVYVNGSINTPKGALCPTDTVVVNATAGECNAVLSAATIAELNGCPFFNDIYNYKTFTPSIDAPFSTGVTTVNKKTFILDYESLNSGGEARCNFYVKVIPTHPEPLVCPSDVNAVTDPGTAFATGVTWDSPAYTSCNGHFILSSSRERGRFRYGSNPVEYRVVGTDISCRFNVNVTLAPQSASCPPTPLRSNVEDCGYLSAPIQVLPTGTGLLTPISITVSHYDTLGFETTYTIPIASAFSDHVFPVGMSVITTVFPDIESCLTIVDVIGGVNDVLSCPSDTVISTLPNRCKAAFSFDEFANCPAVIDVDYSPSFIDSIPVGVHTIERTISYNLFKAPEVYQNLLPSNTERDTVCTYTISVIEVVPQLVCPPNISVFVSLEATDTIVTWVPPSLVFCSPSYSIQSSKTPGSYFPLGETVVTYKIVGTSQECSFLVDVTNNPRCIGSPVYLHAEGCVTESDPIQLVPSSSELYSLIPTSVDVTHTDTLGNVTSYSLSSGLQNLHSFTIGHSEVVSTYGFGVCRTEVIVTGGINAQLVCPSNVQLTSVPGGCSASLSGTEQTEFNRCDGQPSSFDISFSPTLDTDFGFGSNVITKSISYDLAPGGISNPQFDNCTFDVNVTGVPIVICPRDTTLYLSQGASTVPLSWSVAVECSVFQTDLVTSQNSSVEFGLGITTVTAYVVDYESVTCSFKVTVLETPECLTSPITLTTADCESQSASVSLVSSSDALYAYTASSVIITHTDPFGEVATYPGSDLKTPQQFITGSNVVVSTYDFGTCTTIVDVTGGLNEQLVCPSDLTVSAATGRCAALLSVSDQNDLLNCENSSSIYSIRFNPSITDSLPIGVTTITRTISYSLLSLDPADSLVRTCSFDVNVIGVPVVTCPRDTVLYLTSGATDVLLNWEASVSCPVYQLDYSQAPGVPFSAGLTTVDVEVVNHTSTTCSFTVSVLETPLCLASPITLTTSDCESQSASVSLVSSSDALYAYTASSVIITHTDPLGEVATYPGSDLKTPQQFVTGSNVVVSTYDFGTCTTIVNVTGGLNEQLICPSDMIVMAERGECTVVLSSDLVADLNSCSSSASIVSLTYSPDLTEELPLGVTTITRTIVYDLFPNSNPSMTKTDVCVFDIDVRGIPAISCPNDMIVYAPNTDAVPVTWSIPTVCAAYLQDLTVDIEPGDYFEIGTADVTYTVTGADVASCTFSVTVYLIPECLPPTFDLSAVDCTGESAPIALVTDQSPLFDYTATEVVITHTDTLGNVNQYFGLDLKTPQSFAIGINEIIYTYAFEACTTRVVVTGTMNEQLVCPENISFTINDGECGGVMPSDVVNDLNSCVSSSSINSIVFSPSLTTEFPVGITTVTRTVSYQLSNDLPVNIETCTFDVEVLGVPFSIVCPNDTVIVADSLECGAIVSWSPLQLDLQCNVTVNWNSTHLNGSYFPVGETVVTYTAIDNNNHQLTCSFEVQVLDEIAPIFVVNVTDVVCEGQPITWVETIYDACGGVIVNRSHTSGDVFPVGTTTVQIEARDASGNLTTIFFDVTVYPTPNVVSTFDQNIEVCYNNTIKLNVDKEEGVSYYWVFDNVIIGQGHELKLEKANTSFEGGYYVIGETVNGCRDSVQFNVKVVNCGIDIPEAFSPNDDGINDYFEIPILSSYPNSKIWIADRWGVMVFQSDDYKNDWDGRSNSSITVGKGVLPEAAYYYILELGGDGTTEESGKVYKGFVFLRP